MTRARADTVEDHKLTWCQEGPPASTVLEAIQALQPSVYLDIASMVRAAGLCSSVPRGSHRKDALCGAARRMRGGR